MWNWSVKTVRKHILELMSMLTRSPPPSPPRTNWGRLPVVVVLGSTATGKSKLAIDLALKYGGEVISADSMQVYKGLDILTNKATLEEMRGVPHHMIGVVDRKDKFDVVHFRDQALPLVKKILASGKIPFIVGGTNYYIESLLWEILIAEKGLPDDRKRKSTDREDSENLDSQTLTNPIIHLFRSKEGRVEEGDISSWSNQELYIALQMVDSARGNRLHPNDRRKVVRSLQVRFQTGQKHSHLIAQQCSPLECDGNYGVGEINPSSNRALGGPLRFPEALCLWIQADKDILQKRIDERVDNMISMGLKQELDNYIDLLTSENFNVNYEEGLLQSIGFKEFHSYLQLDPCLRNSGKGEENFLEGIARLKIVTRQYARKQLKWINQRFIVPQRREVPPVYTIDGSLVDPESWDRNVLIPSVNIIDAYLENKLDVPLLKERLIVGTCDIEEDVVARICDTCDRVLIGKIQWESHIKSIRHRKVVQKKAKLAAAAAKANNFVSHDVHKNEVCTMQLQK